jgi:hypothetical protein
MNTRIRNRTLLLVAALVIVTAASTYIRADTGTCGGGSVTLPFTDVPSSNIFFCSIAEAYFSALTNGTDATHYSPGANVPREQMAAFVTRTMDQSLKRGSRRGALDQWYTPYPLSLAKTTVGDGPLRVKSDGADLWVTNRDSATISRVRASDGKLLETWTGADYALGVVVARGRVYVTGFADPGCLYEINPTQPAGNVTLIANTLGAFSNGIAFDGLNIWTANTGSGPYTGSVSRIDTVGNVDTFTLASYHPYGILYDGTNIWVTDYSAGALLKLNSVGVILQTVNMDSASGYPIFDGTNIWVPNYSNSVTVVRASTGTVLATLIGNGLNGPSAAAFDGERILVTNPRGNSVSLWKASDFTPIGSFGMGANSSPEGACSDGLNFWIALLGTDKLARF